MSGRRSICKLQGFSSDVKTNEECWYVQGDKLSGLIFKLSLNEITKLDTITKIPRLYQSLTKEDLQDYKITM